MHDRQKQKVYDWENRVVAPHDKGIVQFANIQDMVDYVWTEEGLHYPPRVVPMPKQVTTACADATRTTLRFQPTTYSWIILHELAHSMTSTHEWESNYHGALFLGIYVQLLSRYMRMNIQELAKSCEANGLAIKLDARPVFI